MLVSGQSIYVGSSAITQVYQGVDLIWSKGTIAPAWPGNYFYPNLYFSGNNSGISFWKSNLNSGQTYTLDAHRTDDEGEGGGGFWQINSKSGEGEVSDGEKNSTTTIIPHNNYQNAWVNVYDGWEIHFNSFGSFDSGTAIAFKSQPVYGGNGCYIASAGINWNNIELAISLIPGDNNSQNDRFNALVEKCPNLKYICLNIDGTNTGSTLTLTGSTAWTAESMKFTEWYCPGTTFIIEDNAYWRSIIDWDIAEERNVTFKDINGNIMAVNLERVTSLSEVTTADTYVLIGENHKKIIGYDWNSGTFSHLSFSNYRGQSYYAESDFPSNYLTCKAVASGTGFTLYTATIGQTSKKISAARSGSTRYGHLVLESGSVTPILKEFKAADKEDIGNIGYKGTFPQVDNKLGFGGYMLYDSVYSFPADAFFAGGTSSNLSNYHLFRKK